MLTLEEKQRMEQIQAKSDKPLRWLPCVWCVNLFRKMLDTKLIPGKQQKFLLSLLVE